MADILGDVDANIASNRPRADMKPVKSQNRRKTRVLSPGLLEEATTHYNSRVETNRQSSPTVAERPSTAYNDATDDPPPMFDDVQMSDAPLPSSPVANVVQRKEQAVKVEPEDDDMLEVSEVTGHSAGATANINLKGSRPVPKLIKKESVYPTPMNSSPDKVPIITPETADYGNVISDVNLVSSPARETTVAGKLQSKDVLEPDGSLQFFWTDYTDTNNGSLCLFGKVKDKTTGKFASAFVKVDNILRKLYFLPRQFRHKHGNETTDEVGMKDVYDEVDALMTRSRVTMHKIKPCTRNYAFELPDVPKEAEYLKLLYPYDKPALSADIRGETFSRIFGTNTSLFEQFALWKNVMGPCWLKIEHADFNAVNNASWCKLELQVSKPNMITTLGDTDNLETPPLTLMSLAMRTTMNVKDNKQEILMISARVYENVSLSETTPPEKLPCKTFTVMRPHGDYPVGFKIEAEKHRGVIKLERTEAALLSVFLALLQRADPDVLMGHRLDDVDYTMLLSRMRERKTPGWHRIGRLKRSEWPKNAGRGGGSFFAERHIAAGRLLCDLANDMGKSMMRQCQSWSLDEMCDLILGGQYKRRDVDSEQALKLASSRAGLMSYVKLCEADTYFIAAIALKVQLLPLSKVLTNLAGNSWARTLSGTRAERNEYILLHEFYRNKYICPDKEWSKGRAKAEDDNEGEEGIDTKKKDKYKGGLVFEPEKGLYDKFVLVMDFNSLYPSIIQEYNICFTTVERTEGVSIRTAAMVLTDMNQGEEEERTPDVPADTANKGILPRLIRNLVNRRREVKKLMKDKTATVDQIQTWDIKQQALKLTANSMYGCLGYTKSRFYARPLAMLTTAKGREILQATKDLAESSQGLRVIYGDTDSVMVNTNVDNIADALKIGNEFKKAVNERYELLEIDIDNIFRRLLLHAKKKYAAVNMIEKDGKWVDKLEVKGLDMRRREFCQLSKDISQSLLQFLLSGDETEVVVSQIHDYLRHMASEMRAGKIPIHKYTIFTQLGKAPGEYPNAGSMPAVQVGLKLLARGKSVKAKDVMSFVICGENDGKADAAAKSAAPMEDVLNAESGLSPDIDYYLHRQILPPVERLCAPIGGTNATFLAECLGLDTSKYRVQSSSTAAQGDQNEVSPLDSQVPDHVRFQDCEALRLVCNECRTDFAFAGVSAQVDVEQSAAQAAVTPSGLACPRRECGKSMSAMALSAQLESEIRRHTSRYYAGWLRCDEATCDRSTNRTRQMSVYGHRCLGPRGLAHGCAGRMTFEYGERALYNQLLYLSSIFDADKTLARLSSLKKLGTGAASAAKTESGDEQRDKEVVLVETNRERWNTCKRVANAYLEKSGWAWVSMESVFGFALTAL